MITFLKRILVGKIKKPINQIDTIKTIKYKKPIITIKSKKPIVFKAVKTKEINNIKIIPEEDIKNRCNIQLQKDEEKKITSITK